MLNLKVSPTHRQPRLGEVASATEQAAARQSRGPDIDIRPKSGWSMGWLTRPVQHFVQSAAKIGRQAPAVAAVTLALTMGATGAMAQTPAGAPLTPAAAFAPAPVQAEAEAEPRTHVVRRGESLERIAGQHGTTVQALLQLNDIRHKNLIYPNQVLRLPADAEVAGEGQIYTVKRGDSVARIANKLGVSAQDILSANHLPRPNLIYPGQLLVVPGADIEPEVQPERVAEATPSLHAPATYTVKRGDVLEHIARDVGVPMSRIAELNDLHPPFIIHPAQVLKLRDVAPEPPSDVAPQVQSEAPAQPVPPEVPQHVDVIVPPAEDTPQPHRAPVTDNANAEHAIRADGRLDVARPAEQAATGIAHLSVEDQKIFTETQPRLHWGVNGHAVELVQAQLTRLGYPLGNVDGDFGRRTRSAVRAFQVFNGLRGDGIVGDTTWEKMAAADSVRLPTDGLYEVRSVYRPYTAEAYRLFLRAAADEGLPAEWAIADSLHRVIDAESDGEVGRPNYTYKWRANTPSEWSKIHDELQAGRITAKSSATGIGQLLLSNVRIHYPSGVAGINVPLEEARGMLSYIKSRHKTPDQAWRNYNTVHEGY